MYTYPRPKNLAYPAPVLSGEGALSRGDPEVDGAKLAGPGRPGPSDRLVAWVERREALRPTLLGARGWRYQLRGAKRLLRLKGVPLAHPGASRRSTPPARLAGEEFWAKLGRIAPRDRGGLAV